MPLNAGDLTGRVDLQLDDITFVSGKQVRTPRTYSASVPAQVEPLTGREFWQAAQINSQVSWKVTLRYRTDVLPQHRVIYGGSKRLEILSVQPDEMRKESLVLMCREINAA